MLTQNEVVGLQGKIVKFSFNGVERIVGLKHKPNSKQRSWGVRVGGGVKTGSVIGYLAGIEYMKGNVCQKDTWKSYSINRIEDLRVIQDHS